MSRPGKPARQVLQAPQFAKSKRRPPPSAPLAVDDAVKGLLADPLAGEPKVGALKGVRVVRLKVGAQQLLLAYQFDAKRNVIEGPRCGPAREPLPGAAHRRAIVPERMGDVKLR